MRRLQKKLGSKQKARNNPAFLNCVFFNAQNMYHSARSLFGGRLNFKELLKLAVSGRQLIRAFGYVIRTKTGEEKPFIDALISLGIETREKDLQEFFGGAKKADWDVGMAIDAV